MTYIKILLAQICRYTEAALILNAHHARSNSDNPDLGQPHQVDKALLIDFLQCNNCRKKLYANLNFFDFILTSWGSPMFRFIHLLKEFKVFLKTRTAIYNNDQWGESYFKIINLMHTINTSTTFS